MSNSDYVGRRGRARAMQLAAEMKQAVEINSASLLARLGREPSILEKMQAEMLAALFFRARRLRDSGRNDLEVLREAAMLMRDVPWLRNPVAVSEG